MRVSIITLFPEMFDGVLNLSMLGRGQKAGLLQFEFINLRQFGLGVHQVVDGKPYGGGVGMVLRADTLAAAWQSIDQTKGQSTKTILMSASGQPFNQSTAKELAKIDHLIVVCGHYEGVDQRFIDKYVDAEISIGDFVMTGGEIPAMAVIDAVARLVPGVIKKEAATAIESFENNLLEFPQYTRPDEFEGAKVPEILVSGDHGAVDQWRADQQQQKTASIRPDLSQESN